MRRPLLTLAVLLPLSLIALVLDERGEVGPAEGCSGGSQQPCTYAGWDDAMLERIGPVPTDNRLHVQLRGKGQCSFSGSGAGAGGAPATSAPTIRLYDSSGNEIPSTVVGEIPVHPYDSPNGPSVASTSRALVPTVALEPLAAHQIRVEGLLNGKSETLSFKTGPGPTPAPTVSLITQQIMAQRLEHKICCPVRPGGISCEPSADPPCEALVEAQGAQLEARAQFDAPEYSRKDTALSLEVTSPSGATIRTGATKVISAFDDPPGTYCLVAIAYDTVSKLEGRSEVACVELPGDVTTMKRCETVARFIKDCAPGPFGAGGYTLSPREAAWFDEVCEYGAGGSSGSSGMGGQSGTGPTSPNTAGNNASSGAPPSPSEAASPPPQSAAPSAIEGQGGCSMTPRPAPSHLTAVLTLLAAALFARRRR